MDFPYNIKLRVNILRATKTELVGFMLVTKIESIFTGTKIELIFTGTNIESIFTRYKNRVDFYKVQKLSRFLASKSQKPRS